ncbi:MAG: hypothetical protein IT443_08710 [Phycisphaeraceae bacterium]|nr:hypothetical protein [Phycisphaeraceae bacterium]
MAIRFHCDNCQAKIRVPEGSVGRKVKCPRCGFVQRVTENLDPRLNVVPTILAKEPKVMVGAGVVEGNDAYETSGRGTSGGGASVGGTSGGGGDVTTARIQAGRKRQDVEPVEMPPHRVLEPFEAVDRPGVLDEAIIRIQKEECFEQREEEQEQEQEQEQNETEASLSMAADAVADQRATSQEEEADGGEDLSEIDERIVSESVMQAEGGLQVLETDAAICDRPLNEETHAAAELPGAGLELPGAGEVREEKVESREEKKLPEVIPAGAFPGAGVEGYEDELTLFGAGMNRQEEEQEEQDEEQEEQRPAMRLADDEITENSPIARVGVEEESQEDEKQEEEEVAEQPLALAGERLEAEDSALDMVEESLGEKLGDGTNTEMRLHLVEEEAEEEDADAESQSQAVELKLVEEKPAVVAVRKVEVKPRAGLNLSEPAEVAGRAAVVAASQMQEMEEEQEEESGEEEISDTVGEMKIGVEAYAQEAQEAEEAAEAAEQEQPMDEVWSVQLPEYAAMWLVCWVMRLLAVAQTVVVGNFLWLHMGEVDGVGAALRLTVREVLSVLLIVAVAETIRILRDIAINTAEDRAAVVAT